jgi:TetR/AcrR family transcriptional repressor of nem operon
MKDAGLTNGAFYAPFASKDDLVATAVADQLRTQSADLCDRAAPGLAGLEQIVRAYLSAAPRQPAMALLRPQADANTRPRRG